MSQLVTVVIVSQGRPQSLVLALDALRYQTLPEFEVVVVGGADEERAIEKAGFSDGVNYVAFHGSNISVARNIGTAAAHGDIIAFLDDDAFPGPGWLQTLSSALETSGANFAAGYVRGPDGIKFQFSGAFLFADATHKPIEAVHENRVFEANSGRATEAMGTNAAYTRDTLHSAGGFDPAFAYFLDESDLNWRLVRAGAAAVVVPLAQVVHALAPSAQRSADRVPLTLFAIGRSTRIFLDKHFEGDRNAALESHRAHHRERLQRHVSAGRLKLDRASSILGSFDRGAAAISEAETAPDWDVSVPESEKTDAQCERDRPDQITGHTGIERRLYLTPAVASGSGANRAILEPRHETQPQTCWSSSKHNNAAIPWSMSIILTDLSVLCGQDRARLEAMMILLLDGVRWQEYRRVFDSPFSGLPFAALCEDPVCLTE